MPKRSPDGAPGQTLSKRGILHIRVPDGYGGYVQKSTGLADNAKNRRSCLFLRRRLHQDVTEKGKAIVSGPPLLKDALETFLRLKNIQPHSKRLYELAIGRILKDVRVLAPEKVEQALVNFRKEDKLVSPATYNTYLRHVSAFLRHCGERHGVRYPSTNHEMRRGVRTDNAVFMDDELARIFETVDDLEMKVFLTVMLETGARPVDLLTLFTEQLDFVQGFVSWTNRIHKAVEKRPVSDLALRVLMEHLGIESPELPGPNRKVFRWKHSSLSRINRTFDTLLERSGVAKNGRSLKHLRKTFKHRIRHLPFQMQMFLMRHSAPDVTLTNYTWHDPEEVRAMLNSGLKVAEKS